MNDWKGPFIRYSLQDDNPNIRTGAMSGSPDLIPNGVDIVKDPTELIKAKWTQSVGVSTTSTRKNYLYVRGANSSSRTWEAKVSLYYSPATLLQWPRTIDGKPGWADRPLQTGAGKDYQLLEVPSKDDTGTQGRFVTPDAFEWVPTQLPGNDHYCLVGAVAADGLPDPIPPELDKIDDFAKYISTHPDLGWRNVYTMVPDYDFFAVNQQYLQGKQAGPMAFTVWVEGGRADDMLTMRSSVSGPNPPLEISMVVKGPAKDEMTRRSTIPADYASSIEVTYIAAKGKKVPDDLKLSVEVLRVDIAANSDLAPYARPLSRFGITKVDDVTSRAIRLGATHYDRKLPDNGW